MKQFKPIAIKIQNEDHWHHLRSKNIGASEVGALYGGHGYITPYSLYQQKVKGEHLKVEFSNRTLAGQHFESAIAKWGSLEYGWRRLQFVKRYLQDPEVNLGASLDFLVYDPERKTIVLEIKNVDSQIYKTKWYNQLTQTYEPPLEYLLQVQVQMGLSAKKHASIVACTGGNQLRRFDYEFDEEIFQDIREKAKEFYALKEAPPIEDYSDISVVRQVMMHHFTGTDEQPEEVDDSELDTLSDQLIRVKQEIKDLDKEKDLIMAKLAHKTLEKSNLVTNTHSIVKKKVTKNYKAREAYTNEHIEIKVRKLTHE